MTYVRQYAGEMDEYVIKQHISLYVNDFTINMGESGAKAIEKLISL
jgi:1,4-dihydroxy-6-naphthoate synthase